MTDQPVVEPEAHPAATAPGGPWDQAVDAAACCDGAVLVVGATDCGKTTFAVQAANRAIHLGRQTAVVDADVGQGEAGPPGTLALVRLTQPVATLASERPRLLAFVGDVTHHGHPLAMLQGARRLLSHARKAGDSPVLIDTTGDVSSRFGEKLRLAEGVLLEPELVVLLRRRSGSQRLERLLRLQGSAPVLVVETPVGVRGKSPIYRRTARANRFRRHFSSARQIDFEAFRLIITEGWVYSGQPIGARQRAAAGAALGTQVLHGEVGPDGVWLCVEEIPRRRDPAAVQELFGRRRIAFTPAGTFHNLLVGLIGADGHLLDLGLLRGINFERGLFSVLTPVRVPADVCVMQLGRIRLNPDGQELGRVRPGEL